MPLCCTKPPILFVSCRSLKYLIKTFLSMRMTDWFIYDSGYFINCLFLPSSQQIALLLLMTEEVILQWASSSSENGKICLLWQPWARGAPLAWEVHADGGSKAPKWCKASCPHLSQSRWVALVRVHTDACARTPTLQLFRAANSHTSQRSSVRSPTPCVVPGEGRGHH